MEVYHDMERIRVGLACLNTIKLLFVHHCVNLQIAVTQALCYLQTDTTLLQSVNPNQWSNPRTAPKSKDPTQEQLKKLATPRSGIGSAANAEHPPTSSETETKSSPSPLGY